MNLRSFACTRLTFKSLIVSHTLSEGRRSSLASLLLLPLRASDLLGRFSILIAGVSTYSSPACIRRRPTVSAIFVFRCRLRHLDSPIAHHIGREALDVVRRPAAAQPAVPLAYLVTACWAITSRP